MVTIDAIWDAAKVLQGTAERTLLVPAERINPAASVYLKLENLQRTGSFKVRGASYKIATLSPQEKERGVIACSAGNHAQGVALAARKEGIKAVICMPEGAPLSKIEATRNLGAQVVLCPGVYDDAYNKALELQEQEGYTFVHPFNDPAVIAGQGTVGLEILEQLPEVEVVLCAVGGGGLASGLACALKSLRPGVKVYGVQAAGAPSMAASLEKGEIVQLDRVQTIADGIAVKRPGELTFDLCRQYLDGVVTVTEGEIASAMLALIENHKIVAEGAGAAPVAAAMYNKVELAGKKAVCVVSGGNVDVTVLSRAISKGLVSSGRITELSAVLDDRPRQLQQIIGIVSGEGANIISIHHNRNSAQLDVGNCLVDITVETRDNEHARHLVGRLQQAGYDIRRR